MSTDAPPQATPPPTTTVRLRDGRSTLELRDQDVFGPRSGDLCVRFLRRIFAVPEVESVRVDRPTASASIRYRRGGLEVPELLQKLAAAIRVPAVEAPDQPSPARLLPHDLSGPRWTIHRHQHILSTWEVVGDRPGVVSLRHDLIAADPALARVIARAMTSARGVLGAEIGDRSGTLTIRFDPLVTRPERLLHALEAASEVATARPSEPASGSEPAPVSFRLANTSVALAVLTDFVAPPLWPLTAALLVGSNLGTFREAGGQLGRRELGLPALYTGIAAATLATGQFAPWAAMGWMMRFWKHRYQQEFLEGKRRLLGDLLEQPRFARLETAGGVELEVPVERLGPGDVIRVSPGEMLPHDGKVVAGCGLVDERAVRGCSGLSRKQPEDPVAAGSTVLRGEFRVEVRPSRSPHRASLLAGATVAAIATRPGKRTPSLQGERFAERFVAPTLAAAGVSLVLGGAPMALAIMRADYASGPGLAQPLETLQACARASRLGAIIRDPAALDRLDQIDVVLLGHHAALEVPEAELAGVRIFPGYSEAQVLQYAASALKDLDDERGPALHAACRARRINLLDRIPTDYGRDISLAHRDLVVKVGNLGTRRPPVGGAGSRAADRSPESAIDSLMVGINGQIAGLIDFRHSERPRAAAALEDFRARWTKCPAIGLVSAEDEPRALALARRLGVDFHRGGLSPGDLVQIIRGCRRRGLRVAYVGDCRSRLQAAREADLAVATDAVELEALAASPAAIVLLQPDLTRLAGLCEVARDYRRSLRVAKGSALIPNLACVGGAFLFGFTSLTTVLVTNLGTGVTYARTRGAIGRLERRLRNGQRPAQPVAGGATTRAAPDPALHPRESAS